MFSSIIKEASKNSKSCACCKIPFNLKKLDTHQTSYTTKCNTVHKVLPFYMTR